MNHRVTVNFRSGRLQNSSANSLGKSEHIYRTHNARLHRLHRIVLVMNRRRGAGKVIYLIHFQEDWLDDVVAHKFEVLVTKQMENVFSSPGKEIVETDDIMFLGN